MSIVVTAIEDVYGVNAYHMKKLFLAGGITNCPDWQKEMIGLLANEDIIMYNPRRDNFPMDDPDASNQQITWEYEKLAESDMILFWFSKGSINPIVLYELGRWGNSSNRNIFIGIDPGYERTQDVEIQTELSRPDIKIARSLGELALQVFNFNS